MENRWVKRCVTRYWLYCLQVLEPCSVCAEAVEMIRETCGICCVNGDPGCGMLQVQSRHRSCCMALMLAMGSSVVSKRICATAKGKLRGCLAVRRCWT